MSKAPSGYLRLRNSNHIAYALEPALQGSTGLALRWERRGPPQARAPRVSIVEPLAAQHQSFGLAHRIVGVIETDEPFQGLDFALLPSDLFLLFLDRI